MGSPDFALPTLTSLARHTNIVGVVTQPDRRAGRSKGLTPPPVKVLAEELGGMLIWIAGFGDPYLKGGRGGGMSNSSGIFKTQVGENDRKFLTVGGVFSDAMIDGYIDLKMGEVTRLRMTTHPVEYDMYYSL